MKIIFAAGWSDSRFKTSSKIFKDSDAAGLFEKYFERIKKDFECEILPMSFENLQKQTGMIWICERAQKTRMLSSSELSARFQKICDSGTKSLMIWIGGPDGIGVEELAGIKPDLIWSFGPLTLPHELAAVVAAEQIYRAISILKNHPYHTGH